MRRLPLLTLGLGAAILLSLSACQQKTVTGEGDNTEIVRTVSSFDKLDIAGNYHLIVKLTESQSVTINTQANLAPYIITKVNGTTLSIHDKPSVKLLYKK